MHERFLVVPHESHNRLIRAAYRHRGFTEQEADAAARFAAETTRHGNRTHNAIKALHLDELFGSRAGGCRPGAAVEKVASRFAAAEVWNANRKLGQAVALDAIETCIALADRYGTGTVSVDNAFHYLWGGGYVLGAARRGYIAYTNCTAALAEVAPFGGRHPTLGTNPHSWAFPTTDAVGFPVLVDWATSVVAMGRVQQLAREGGQLPAGAAVDAQGAPTTDPARVAGLLPFGAHKGYGLSLVNELVGAFIGGSLPTVRSRWQTDPDDKHTPCFFFQVTHPEALAGHNFARGRSQAENVRAVLADILGHGNDAAILPGQIEARAAARSDRLGGLLFSDRELEALNEIARECGAPELDPSGFPEAD